MGRPAGTVAMACLLLLMAGCSAPDLEQSATAEPSAKAAQASGMAAEPSATTAESRATAAGPTGTAAADIGRPSEMPWPADTPTPRPSVTPVPTRTPMPGVAPSGKVLATIEAIELEMEALRGLEETSPMTRTLLTREELTLYLERQFGEEYRPQEVEADTRFLAAFNFVTEEIDLRQVLLDLYSAQVLGMYDQDVDTLFVVSDGEFDLTDRLTLAHEYVHGLQDQAFGLDSLLDEDLLNDDQYLARLALSEGDAILAMNEYFLAHLRELSQEELQSLQEEDEGSAAALAAAPAIIQETLAFPYAYGTELVTALQEKGWRAVDTAYADPPQSTEQILHPEKYLERDEPQLVSLPPLTDTLGAGWSRIDEETLGEFQTSLYLAQQVDQATAEKASAGWDGDRYAVYGRDEDVLLVLVTVWDSEADGQEFVSVYQQYVAGTYGLDPSRVESGEIWWQTPGQVTVLGWQGDRTLIVVGPDLATVSRVLSGLDPWGQPVD